MQVIFYDLETNGLDVLTNSIMQMTMVDDGGGVLLNEYVYPFDGVIAASHIHGIDQKKLETNNALQLSELIVLCKKKLRELYQRDDILWVAYNNFGFDQIVLEANCKKANIRIPENWFFMDLLPLIRNKFYDIQPNYKLSSVYQYFFKTNEEIHYHNSLDDTLCLFEIFEKCKDFEGEFYKYIRKSFRNHQINECPLSTIHGVTPSMHLENFEMKSIGDLYNIYASCDFEREAFIKLIKEKFQIRSQFHASNMEKQMKYIYELQK